ncbi:FtsX-like permease family protein [Demequina salsinemoris]|uniref:FtsX-like permease family protein n=1 Tax=Demequina salsinemoris TaxID=577470 RepID=UPI000784A000|nr:FtsX-like permease family protein [Demequina salsinemoris]
MRHLSWIAVGVVATLWGWAIGPVWDESAGIYNAILPGSVSVVFLTIYAPLLIALGAAVTGTLDAAHLATRRAELTALHALGQTRSSIVAGMVRRSAARAAIVAGASLVLGGAAAQVRLAALGWTSRVNLDWGAVGELVAAWFMLVVAATLGTWWATVWATRAESASPTGPTPGTMPRDVADSKRRPRWPWIALTFAVVTIGTMLVPGITDSTSGLVIALGIAASLSLYLLIPVVLVYWGSGLGNRIIRRLGRALGGDGATGSARSLAADALVRPAPLRVAAIGAVGLVVGVTAGAGVMLNGQSARNALAYDMMPDAEVSTVDFLDDPSQPGWTGTGWAPALDEDMITSLESDNRLVVVRTSVLRTEETPAPADWGLGENDMQAGETLIAIEPDALDEVAPPGLRVTYLDYGVGIGGVTLVALDGTVTELDSPSATAPFLAVDRAWAEDQFGAAADSMLLIYAADPSMSGDDFEAALLSHDLGDAVVSTPYSDFGSAYSADGVPIGLRDLTQYGGPFLLVAVGIVIALSAATQRLRAREHATLVALGVQSGTLRTAAAIEAGTVTAVGAALGLVAGTVLGTFLSALNGAGGLGIRLWNAGFDLAQAPWGALLALVVASVALAAGLAALIRVRGESRTPAEQLREADKAGVR